MNLGLTIGNPAKTELTEAAVKPYFISRRHHSRLNLQVQRVPEAIRSKSRVFKCS